MMFFFFSTSSDISPKTPNEKYRAIKLMSYKNTNFCVHIDISNFSSETLEDTTGVFFSVEESKFAIGIVSFETIKMSQL